MKERLQKLSEKVFRYFSVHNLDLCHCIGDDILDLIESLSVEPKPDPEFTYKYDPDFSNIEIFVNGELAVEWWCETDPDDHLEEFKKVYMMGANSQSVEPKAESVEPKIIQFQMTHEGCILGLADNGEMFEAIKGEWQWIMSNITPADTLPSVKPVMPELPKREYIEAMQKAIDDGFGMYCAYEALWKALMNSADKDKVNE